MTNSDGNTGRMYTIAEVAEKLRVHPKTIRRWIHAKGLGAFRPGRQWLISEQDIKRFLRANWHG